MKFKSPLHATVPGMFCPVCGAIPYTPEPHFPNEVPKIPTETECRICTADLVRVPNGKPHNGTDWQLREGAAAPEDDGTWQERARQQHEERKAAELAQLRAFTAKEFEHYKCPECGEHVDIQDAVTRPNLTPAANQKLLERFWQATTQTLHCPNCRAGLRRPAEPMPLEYRGQTRGHTHPWTFTGEYALEGKKETA